MISGGGWIHEILNSIVQIYLFGLSCVCILVEVTCDFVIASTSI